MLYTTRLTHKCVDWVHALRKMNLRTMMPFKDRREIFLSKTEIIIYLREIKVDDANSFLNKI